VSGTVNNTGHSVVFTLDEETSFAPPNPHDTSNSGGPVSLMRGFTDFTLKKSRVRRNEDATHKVTKRGATHSDLRTYLQGYDRTHGVDSEDLNSNGHRVNNKISHLKYYSPSMGNETGDLFLNSNRLIESTVRSRDRFSHKEGARMSGSDKSKARMSGDEGRMYGSLSVDPGLRSAKTPIINVTGGPLSYRYQVR